MEKKSNRDLIAEVVAAIDSYENRVLRKLRIGARDKLGGDRSEFRKQHDMDTLKRYLNDVADANETNIYARLMKLSNFLVEDHMLEKAFTYDTEAKKILAAAWKVRNDIANNIVIPKEEKAALDAAKIKYDNRQLADGLIEHLKVLNPGSNIDEQFRARYLVQRPSTWLQLTVGHKISDRKKIVANLEKIRDLVKAGMMQEAVNQISLLQDFMHNRIKDAEHTLTATVLNDLQANLKKAYPDITIPVKSEQKAFKTADQLPLKDRVKDFTASFAEQFALKIESHHLNKTKIFQQKGAGGFSTDIAGMFDHFTMTFAIKQMIGLIPIPNKTVADITGTLITAAIKGGQAEARGIDQSAADKASQNATRYLARDKADIIANAVGAEFMRRFAYQLSQANITAYDKKFMNAMLNVGIESMLKNLHEFNDEFKKIDWNNTDGLKQFAKVVVQAMCYSPGKLARVTPVRLDTSKHHTTPFSLLYRGGKVDMEDVISKPGYVLMTENGPVFYNPKGSEPSTFGYIFVDKTDRGAEHWPLDVDANANYALKQRYTELAKEVGIHIQEVLNNKAEEILNRTEVKAQLLQGAAKDEPEPPRRSP